MANITKINGSLITADTASYAISASFVTSAITTSFATSASYVQRYSGVLFGHPNSLAAVAGTIYGGYIGSPVTPAIITSLSGSDATAVNPGFIMPACTASNLLVIQRGANGAGASYAIYLVNQATGVSGSIITIAAGASGGILRSGSAATVPFAANQRAYVVFASTGGTGAIVSTFSFRYDAV
jgi:hypothetical protein